MTYSVSIIIPVYNVAPYLRRCLDSISSQAFTDWEVICVDDGSVDGSGAIIDEYVQRDDRFRVVHQDNAGVSAARNVALDMVRGEYFTFLDADDVMLPEALECCVNAFTSGNYDAVCCEPLCVTFSNENALAKDGVFSREFRPVLDRMELLWGKNGEYGYSCGRMYRTSKFSSVRFPVGMKMCEDAWHWIDSLMIQAKWCALDRPMIGYRQVANSASNTFDAEFNRCIFKAYAHTCESLRGMDYVCDEPMRLFWHRHGRAICHHLKLLFRDWNTFTKSDKSDLAEMVARIPIQMGWNPFLWHMRWRVFSLRKSYAHIVLLVLGFFCDWLWPRAKRRLWIGERWWKV